MKTTFIYALKELKPGEFSSTNIRYVGKSNDPYKRFGEHLSFAGKTHLGCWIRGLPAKGMGLQLEILDEIPELEWEFWEREYIRLFRSIGFNLVNGSDGGEGVQGPKSLAWREKMRKPKSAAHKAKLRAAKIGTKQSPETIEKIKAWSRRPDVAIALRAEGKARICGRKRNEKGRLI